MDKYFDLAERAFAHLDEESYFSKPKIIQQGRDLFLRFIFAHDLEEGFLLGNGLDYPWLLGFREFNELLKNVLGFSIQINIGTSDMFPAKYYGQMYVGFQKLSGNPGIVVYPEGISPPSKETDEGKEFLNRNLRESARFLKLEQKVEDFFGKMQDFHISEKYLADIRGETIEASKILPIKKYFLGFSGEDLEKFREIVDLCDSFGISAEMIEKFMELRFDFTVYNVKF